MGVEIITKVMVHHGPKKGLVDVVFGNFGRGLKKGIDVHVGKILTCLGGEFNKVWHRCI